MKYELTNETKKQILGITLYRIRALSNFSDVSAGDLGGFIEKESNLSQTGDAWVSGDALVYGTARVSGDALVYDTVRVYGDALVYGNAQVYDTAQVYGNALVYGKAQVHGNAQVYDTAQVTTTKRKKKHVE